MGWFSRKQPVVHDLKAVDVARGIAEGRVLLVDVREPNEVAVEAYPALPGTTNLTFHNPQCSVAYWGGAANAIQSAETARVCRAAG